MYTYISLNAARVLAIETHGAIRNRQTASGSTWPMLLSELCLKNYWQETRCLSIYTVNLFN